ncbi:MAG: ABC transporter substrate-binding protein [Bryobacterales bacterium]|nr:ABC transporter substrate-binding protein [Bryobacterales bacterium]MBV9401600.1 ABC transporter substrate-binding protein [Bryobacterales bacterium]
MRIVSLLASGTEIVCALGLGDFLVGRSHECDNPGWVRSLPQCSEPAFDISVSSRDIDTEVNRRIRSGEPLYTIHHDRIAELHPDVIIAQRHCEVCAITPRDLTPEVRAKVIPLSAFSLQDIFESIHQIARGGGVPEQRAEEVICDQRKRLDRVRRVTEGLRRPTVVVLEWTDPLFSMGNWGPELVEIAGGEPLLAAKGQYSRAIPAEQLREADPEVLIVAPCGFDRERSQAEEAVLEKLPWWSELRAVKNGRVVFEDGNLYFNRSGMTITRTAEIIAAILHSV